MKFKVGDYVKVITKMATTRFGEIGKITNIEYDGINYDYSLSFKDGKDAYTTPYADYELELAKNQIITNILNDL